MDQDLIADLLRPFLAPITDNILGVSCGEPGLSGTREAGPSQDALLPKPVTLSITQLNSISTYIDLLIRWNSRINLTAIRDPEQIVTRHFGESLFAARVLFPVDAPAVDRQGIPIGSVTATNASPGHVTQGLSPEGLNRPMETVALRHLLDIGSGAGFPALPMKIWAPQIQVTLVESNQKKATFLREVTRTLTLTNVNVISSRAEDLPSATADIVTLRAVERFDSILPTALRLVRPGSRLALLIGESQLESSRASSGIDWNHPSRIPLSTSRVLLIGDRIKH